MKPKRVLSNIIMGYLGLRRRFLLRKGQSLSELAIFGALLLLVLAFFVRYSMMSSHQQESQMKGFRYALDKSSRDSNIGGNPTTVSYIKDKPVADPRNPFGMGDWVTTYGGGSIIWGNEASYAINPDDPSTIPTINFVVNGVNVEKKLGAFKDVSFPSEGFDVKLGREEYHITQSNTQVYVVKYENEDEEIKTLKWKWRDENGDIQEETVRIPLIRLPCEDYEGLGECFSEKEVLWTADITGDGVVDLILDISGQEGGQITGFTVLDYTAGDISSEDLDKAMLGKKVETTIDNSASRWSFNGHPVHLNVEGSGDDIDVAYEDIIVEDTITHGIYTEDGEIEPLTTHGTTFHRDRYNDAIFEPFD